MVFKFLWFIYFVFIACLIIYCTKDVYLTKNNMMRFWKLIKDNIFKIVFASFAAYYGYKVANNQIGGKIIAGILAFAIGFGIAVFLDFFIKRIKIKPIKILLHLTLCILIGYFAITTAYNKYHKVPQKYYDRYGKSYYNEDDRDEAEFMYDVQDAADEYRRTHR